jgi:TonB-linked SusC/RagA family outer membrane protein
MTEMKKYYFLKAIKIFILIIFFTNTLSASVASNTQTITLKARNLSFTKVLEEIRLQTSYAVYINAEHLKYVKPVSITSSKMPITEFLNKVLENQPLTAKIENKTILLIKKNVPNKSSNNAEPSLQETKQLTLTGVVTSSEDGSPLSGVSISIKGTGKGINTDATGSYRLPGVKENDIVFFSIIGFQTKEISVNGRTQINVQMSIQPETLNQVMVVAFGTAKKSTFTGSASVIGEDTFKNKPSTEVSQALAGTTPGLQIGTSHGLPGSEPTIRIRGIGSFNANNSPLIILDGVPYDNAISSINPNDIENVTVLKDAASAALYGARGANGVILINTKKGRSGKPKADAKYSYGLTSRQSSDYERLGERDYMEYYWEAHRNSFVASGDNLTTANNKANSAVLAGMVYNPYLMTANELFDANGKLNPAAVNRWSEDTDWYGGITRVGKRHDGSLSISGGNEKSDYYTSLGYVKEEGFVIGSVYDRVSAKANVNSKVTDWLKIGSNLTLASAKYNGEQTETSGTIANPFRSTRFLGPLYPIHLHDPATGEYILDENGNKIPDFGGGWTSPDGTIVVPKRPAFVDANHPYELQQNLRGGLRQTLNLKGYADVNLLKDLKFTANGSLGANAFRSWNGQYIFPLKNNAGSSAQNTSTSYTWNFQQLLNYNKRIGDHNFDVLAGHESYRYQYWYMSTSMKTQTIPNNNFEYANYSELNALPNSYTHNYRVEGYLSRVNYDYKEKYFASASFRRDGSSRFHKDARWGNFWSLGAGWSMEKEDFLQKINFVNQLKLRGSYGVVGNDDLDGYYPWRATYEVLSNGEPGYSKATLENKNLTWETSKSFDFGLDFAFFKYKLKGSFEYFNRVSDNLLFEVPQPISSGIPTINQNAGTMYNRGF